MTHTQREAILDHARKTPETERRQAALGREAAQPPSDSPSDDAQPESPAEPLYRLLLKTISSDEFHAAFISAPRNKQ